MVGATRRRGEDLFGGGEPGSHSSSAQQAVNLIGRPQPGRQNVAKKLQSLDISYNHGLDIDELLDAEMRQLAAIAAVLNSAEW